VGFFVMKLPNALLWAMLVTTVDILPILGVGTVLVPWSLVSYLQGSPAKAVTLLCIFLVVWLVRSMLEPKLIGRELGLDPLVTLLCIYGGFRLWGIIGMLLAPLAAICVVQLWRIRQEPEASGPA
jgi:predicted PurR-regulated permease PerM